MHEKTQAQIGVLVTCTGGEHASESTAGFTGYKQSVNFAYPTSGEIYLYILFILSSCQSILCKTSLLNWIQNT
jgi:hypothetical protein